MEVERTFVGTLLFILTWRCFYLEFYQEKLASQVKSLEDVLHKTQLALTDAIMKTWPNGEPPTKYPEPVSGCNDPERLAG